VGSPSETDALPVRTGDILADKYRIEGTLGTGGMGVVVAATHLKLGTRVAIKFLRPSVCEAPEAVERFLREARAAARIEGEHVARVTDVATLDSGSPYMVMELLRGSDLAGLLKKERRLEVAAAVEYVLQACEAIAEAHAMGLVHRDLKPSNLFLTRRPDGTPLVKVLDFGISKTLMTARASLLPGSLTDPSSSIGSPLYMSPEQIRGAARVDHRTDIWSLGVVLHELVAGRPPFVRDSLPALYVAIAEDAAAPLCSVRPDVPEPLETVVLRCLEKDPALRVQSIADLAQALAAVAPKSAQTSIERIVRIANAPSPYATTTDPAPNVDPHGPTEPLSASRSSAAGHSAWGATRRSSLQRAVPWVALGGLVAAVGLAAVAIIPSGVRRTPPTVGSAGEAGLPQTTTSTPMASVQPAAPLAASSSSGAGPDAAAPSPSASAATSVKSPSRPPPRVTTKKDSAPPGRDGLDDRN
jgi:serine/threonine protein kinase